MKWSRFVCKILGHAWKRLPGARYIDFICERCGEIR